MTPVKVTENCIVDDVDIEHYHSQGVCDGPSVSSSNLRTLEIRSAAHAYAGWSGNPNRVEATSPAFVFGSAAHAIILGDEIFETRHAVSPFKDFASTETIDGVVWKPRRPGPLDQSASAQTKRNYERAMEAHDRGELRYKSDWSLAMEEAGRRVITKDDLAHIHGMAESLHASVQAREALLSGAVEQSAFYRDEKTGLWVKSRMDVRPVDDTLADLKKAADAAPFACAKAITNYRYDMQFALGAELLWRIAGQKITGCLAIFIEDSPPYAVTPYPISPHAIERAAQQNRRALDTFAECLSRNEWPAYLLPDNYLPPEWLEKRLAQDEEGGLLPSRAALGWLDEMEGA